MSAFGTFRKCGAAAAIAVAVAVAAFPASALAWDVTTTADGASVLSSFSRCGDHKLEFICQLSADTADRFYVRFSGVDWRPRMFIGMTGAPGKVPMRLRRDRGRPWSGAAVLSEGTGQVTLTVDEMLTLLDELPRTRGGYVVQLDAEHGVASAMFPSDGLVQAAKAMTERCNTM